MMRHDEMASDGKDAKNKAYEKSLFQK
jgi:hypothetical protein